MVRSLGCGGRHARAVHRLAFFGFTVFLFGGLARKVPFSVLCFFVLFVLFIFSEFILAYSIFFVKQK